MNERWRRVKDIYHKALALEPAARKAYLSEACHDDRALRLEVMELLQYNAEAESHAFLEKAAIEMARPQEIISAFCLAPPGQRIGPYEIHSLLGEGGMGLVYDATDMRLGRRVALKLLRSEIVSNPDARGRFLREARSAAGLSHTGIATIYDAGENQGRLYIAMEFVDGHPLRSFLTGPAAGALAEPVALSYATQLASALDHAHSRGILHRDIKPENVIVENSGAVKLVDFGIAKAVSVPSEGAETGITKTGMFVGTLRYASPETIAGGAATHQSDLYSLGVVLFEMLCGQTPFEGFSGMAMTAAILKGEAISLRNINAAVSEELVQLVERSIARDPENRFATAEEMLGALRDLHRPGAGAVPVRRARGNVPSLVILEFTNLSRDPTMDWLGTGIVETLDADLRKLGVLQVVARARTLQAVRGLGGNKDETGGLIALGNRLGAKWIATGSFQRSGNRIRVIPKVFKVLEGESIPAEKIDGVWEDLFEVQDRVVDALLRALEIDPRPLGRVRATSGESRLLDAYEHYANGRRFMNEMGRDSLAQAKHHFHNAIACDPRYGVAYSGLGTSHALSFIHNSSPEELELARLNLERAIEIDSELGEPYPWLCYVYNRLGDFKKGAAMGAKGVALQPDLAQAHYFYAGSQFLPVELGFGSYQKAIDSLTRSIQLDPRMGAQWLLAGSVALSIGHHGTARELFERARQVEAIPNVPLRFVGAMSMLGFVHSRLLDWEVARNYHTQSIELLRGVEHVYRDVFTALSACGLGEIELRVGNPADALTRFRHAWRIVKEEKTMVGSDRLGIRSQAGMAAAYATLAERDKSEQHLAEAISGMASVKAGSWVWDTLLLQLHYSIASAQLRLNLLDEAIASLDMAVNTGLADAYWFDNDPEWKAIRDRQGYLRLTERIRLIPPLHIDLSRFPSPDC